MARWGNQKGMTLCTCVASDSPLTSHAPSTPAGFLAWVVPISNGSEQSAQELHVQAGQAHEF
jgi:hypothetical protein